jgi:hypothetical protein
VEKMEGLRENWWYREKWVEELLEIQELRTKMKWV